MDAHNEGADKSSTGAAPVDTTTSVAGTKRHMKHKSRDWKRQRPQCIEEENKSPDSAVSKTETSTKTSKRPKKSREPRDDGGARDAQKTPEVVAASPDAQEKPQPELRLPALPSTCTDQILLRLAAQEAPTSDATPYQHLASALNCSDTDKSMSAWVSCFRAAPVEELLKAAQTPSHILLKFAPHYDMSAVLKPDLATTPHIV